jgi:hypothetical protein
LSDSSSTRDEINDEDAKLLKDILEQTSGINQEKMDKVARFYQSRKAKFQENPLLIYNLLTEAGLSPYRAQAGRHDSESGAVTKIKLIVHSAQNLPNSNYY